jgi:hypothetical protein
VRSRILAVLLLAPCLAGALAFGASRSVNDEPIGAANGATGVLWGDRVFTSRRQLTTWLNAHGARYDRWSRRHPRAAALLV